MRRSLDAAMNLRIFDCGEYGTQRSILGSAMKRRLPEAEGESAADAGRPAPILQEIVEEMVVDLVCLHPHTEMTGEVVIEATAEAVEALPIGLVAAGDQMLHNQRLDGILRPRGHLLTHCADLQSGESDGR